MTLALHCSTILALPVLPNTKYMSLQLTEAQPLKMPITLWFLGI